MRLSPSRALYVVRDATNVCLDSTNYVSLSVVISKPITDNKPTIYIVIVL